MSDNSNMITKDIPATTVIAITRQVTLPEISPTAEVCVPELYQVAKSAGLPITGPCTFIYDGSYNDDTTPIYLTIAIPVDADLNTQITESTLTGIHICKLPACKAACIEHTGGIENISDTYQKVFDQADQNNIQLHCEHTREVYHYWVDYDAQDNQTEIQIAIESAA